MYGIVAEVIAWLAALARGAFEWARHEYRHASHGWDLSDPHWRHHEQD
jgi:hypothetical protein